MTDAELNKTRESLMRRKMQNLTGELQTLLETTNDLPNVNHLRSRARAALSALSAEKPPPPPPPQIRFSRPGEKTDHAVKALHHLEQARRNLSSREEREDKFYEAGVHSNLAINDTLKQILSALTPNTYTLEDLP